MCKGKVPSSSFLTGGPPVSRKSGATALSPATRYDSVDSRDENSVQASPGYLQSQV